MSNVIKLKKGLNIQLAGAAEKILSKTALAKYYAVRPDDFKGITPRLCVNIGDEVKAGTPVFFDKYRPDIKFVSPVSGKVSAINRGEKRHLTEIIVEAEKEQVPESYEITPEILGNRDEIIKLMMKAGYWPFIIQRPYGIIANPSVKPKAVFISGFDSSPLTLDVDFMLSDRIAGFQNGIDILKKLAGKVYIGLNADDTGSKLLKVKNAELVSFSGKHPVGNTGIQIHHISPMTKGETAWTIDSQHVAMLGQFFATGKYSADKIVGICGSEVKRPQYVRVLGGVPISSFTDYIKDDATPKRYISGNVLTGLNVGQNGYLGFYHNRVSVIPEGNYYRFLGWAEPRLDKFSASKAYFSRLFPNKKYNLDTNMNGELRAFTVSNQYEKVLPMNIYPVYLLKAILAEDVEQMEQLGIYEVIEEDLALCEYVCSSKIQVQALITKGIGMMIKEMS